MDLFLLLLPWMVVGTFAALVVRVPPALPPLSEARSGLAPMVSIVVPARNEEENIGRLLASLVRSEYPNFEVLVVDDESQDRTPALVKEADSGRAGGIRLVRGEPLPEGWFGKPWACFQGAREARGELILFTDADTVHSPDLLPRAVAALGVEEAHALTLVGRQVMGSFWERLLQPQFFILLAFRFPRTGSPRTPRRWRHAIANGQYLLLRREVYEALGGHRSVRGEVVEDVRLAQLLARGGWRLLVRESRGLRTRMYRSLGGLVEGWSKNITTGALQTTASWLVPFILPLSFLVGSVLWLLPPTVLFWNLAAGSGGASLWFGLLATGFGVLFWGLAAVVMRGNPLYGFLYPLGSLLAAYIFLLSWVQGGRISWKGRRYVMGPGARRGPPPKNPGRTAFDGD